MPPVRLRSTTIQPDDIARRRGAQTLVQRIYEAERGAPYAAGPVIAPESNPPTVMVNPEDPEDNYLSPPSSENASATRRRSKLRTLKMVR